MNDVFIHPSLPTSLNGKLAFSFEKKPPDYKDFHIVCPFAYCAMCPCYVVYRKCCFCLPSSLRFVVLLVWLFFLGWVVVGELPSDLRVWFAFSFILPFFFSFYCLLFGFVFFLLFVCFCVVVLLFVCCCCYLSLLFWGKRNTCHMVFVISVAECCQYSSCGSSSNTSPTSPVCLTGR